LNASAVAMLIFRPSASLAAISVTSISARNGSPSADCTFSWPSVKALASVLAMPKATAAAAPRMERRQPFDGRSGRTADGLAAGNRCLVMLIGAAQAQNL
jgi:hypothetical protein